MKKYLNQTALLLALLFTLLLGLTTIFVMRGLIAYSAEPQTGVVPPPLDLETITPSPTAKPTQTPTKRPTATPVPVATATIDSADLDAQITIDVEADVRPISPLIYGVSLPPKGDYMQQLRPTFVSWGGNPTSRYNWQAGNLWNGANDYLFINGTYGLDGVVYEQFLDNAATVDAATRMSVPMLGWVAKDNYGCSFRDDNGDCYVPPFDCRDPQQTADPHTTSVPSTPDDIAAWMQAILDSGRTLDFVALDSEPELWGFTHFDVHPECVTYQEIVDRSIMYGEAIRSVMPDAKIVGPNTCCWHFYFQSAAGIEDRLNNGDKDFLPWYLEQMRLYEEQTGVRLIDVLDIHYYPEGLFRVAEETDETRAKRLMAPRSLWDETYIDPSWVNDTIMLIPRVSNWIETEYPGTQFGISEWNFGADDTMNGALAVAESLGIFGRYGVDYASYWDYPRIETPTFDAFKLFTNYDDAGGQFGDTSVAAASDDEQLRSFAAVDSETGNLHVLLINQSEIDVKLSRVDWAGFSAEGDATQYIVDAASSDEIIVQSVATGTDHAVIELPPYSVSHIVVTPVTK